MDSGLKPRLEGIYAVTAPLSGAALTEVVEAVLRGGVRAVQYRDKGDDQERRLEEALALRRRCSDHGAVFIVNDDVELAAAVKADGVHLGGADAAVEEARERLGESALIGASCYAEWARAERAVAAGADYLAFGSVFASSTKPDAPRAPWSLFREARALGCPLVAIGGIGPDNVHEVARSGADAAAVVSALFAASDPEAAAREMVKRWCAASGARQ